METVIMITAVCFALSNIWGSHPLFTRVRETLEAKMSGYIWWDFIYMPVIACPVCMPFVWGWFFTSNIWLILASSGIAYLLSRYTE